MPKQNPFFRLKPTKVEYCSCPSQIDLTMLQPQVSLCSSIPFVKVWIVDQITGKVTNDSDKNWFVYEICQLGALLWFK
jgi:hypothetical protein